MVADGSHCHGAAGCNYCGTFAPLRGCANDAWNVQCLLRQFNAWNCGCAACMSLGLGGFHGVILYSGSKGGYVGGHIELYYIEP